MPLKSISSSAIPSVLSDRLGLPHLRSVFQPIVDLMTGQPIGYEVLTRGDEPQAAPEPLFRSARASGQLWELERACRKIAIARIAELTVPETCMFFLNVSPGVLQDPRFVEGFTLAQLVQHGVDPARIVIEITEDHMITDREHFQQVVSHYTRQGFRFAADDFGSGHSSLLSLIDSTPQFIKLDLGVVRDIDREPYKRNLVRSLTTFAASVDTRLIAEGVETWGELEMLLRLGVRYAQGFLLGRPSEQPAIPSEDVQGKLKHVLRSAQFAFGEVEETIGPLATMPMTISMSAMTAEQLEETFRRAPNVDHAVVVEDGKPCGLITREHLFSRLAGRYAYALRQRKRAQEIVKSSALTVAHSTPITTLAQRAMERAAADLYDPVVVVDADGILTGTVTMRALIRQSVELQVRSAQNANPLTGLPGNRAILTWINAAASLPTLTLVYADLDRFKEYNDRYGFLMGDELIRLAARVLGRALLIDEETARLGHVGGDDFVAVFPDGVDPGMFDLACEQFDREKLELFDPEDIARGAFITHNRVGKIEEVPLVTISLAVIERSRIGGELHPGLLGQLAASLKSKAKQKTAIQRRSAYMIERRTVPG